MYSDKKRYANIRRLPTSYTDDTFHPCLILANKKDCVLTGKRP